MNKILLSIFLFLIVSCSPNMVEVKERPNLSFNKTEEYHIDLDSIKKPDPPVFIYGNVKDNGKDISIIGSEDLKNINRVVILTPEEFNKISQLVDLSVTYKKIILKQEDLVNEDIKIINSLKEFIEIERLKSDEYEKMWARSENMYRTEEYERRKDNVINKAIQMILSCGIIVVALQ